MLAGSCSRPARSRCCRLAPPGDIHRSIEQAERWSGHYFEIQGSADVDCFGAARAPVAGGAVLPCKPAVCRSGCREGGLCQLDVEPKCDRTIALKSEAGPVGIIDSDGLHAELLRRCQGEHHRLAGPDCPRGPRDGEGCRPVRGPLPQAGVGLVKNGLATRGDHEPERHRVLIIPAVHRELHGVPRLLRLESLIKGVVGLPCKGRAPHVGRVGNGKSGHGRRRLRKCWPNGERAQERGTCDEGAEGISM